jgi:hypothetical protein
MGRVRLSSTLLIAAGVEAVGLVVVGLTTYLVGITSGVLQWLIPPFLALLAAMAKALIEATATGEADRRERRGYRPTPYGGGVQPRARRGTPSVTAILVVLLVVGVGGFGLAVGVRHAFGYFTGREPGVERLVEPASGSSGALALTVEHVSHTAHFTRVDLAVQNGGNETVELPVFGNCVLGTTEGVTLEPDSFRSEWSTTVPPGAFQRGTVTFVGHLPDGELVAQLSFSHVFGFGFTEALIVENVRIRPTPDS